MIEFALLAPLLFLVLFGITEFGRAFENQQAITGAAREGARIAAVTAPDHDAVEARVEEVLDAAGVTASSILVEGPLGTPESTVRVTVETEFTVLSGTILGPFSGTITLQAVSVMRHES